MPKPTPADLDRARHELANHLLAMQENLGPIFDAADGMRAEMLKRDWSPTAAEQAALTWLCGAIQQATMGGRA